MCGAVPFSATDVRTNHGINHPLFWTHEALRAAQAPDAGSHAGHAREDPRDCARGTAQEGPGLLAQVRREASERHVAAIRETAKQWAPYVALISAFVISNGYMTATVNGRLSALESRVSYLEERLDTRIDRLESKMDALDNKFDQLLIALAGRGDVVPAKPEGKHSGTGT